MQLSSTTNTTQPVTETLRFGISQRSNINHQQQNQTFSVFDYAFLAFFGIMIITFFLLYLFSEEFRQTFFDILTWLTKLELTDSNIMVIWGLGYCLTIICLGTGLYEMIIGFIFQNFYFSLILILSARCLGILTAYYLSTGCLKNIIEKWFSQNETFQIVQYMAKRKPFKTLILIRLSFLPMFLKNYGGPLLGYAILQFLGIAASCDMLYIGIAILFGMYARTLDEIQENEVSVAPQWLKVMPVILIVLGSILVLALVFITRRAINNIRAKYTIEEIRALINQDEECSSHGTVGI